MAQSQSIYDGFAPAGYEEWKKNALKEVKGQEAFEQLFTQSPDGIPTQPYYTIDDIAGKTFAAVEKNTAGWEILEQKTLTDPLMALAEKGEWNKIDSIVSSPTQSYGVDAAVYHNAGAETCFQIACTLAHANEYYTLGAKHITVNVAVGSNYFFEIAKLRAVRQLMALLTSQYEGVGFKIHCETALNNTTIYDYNNNILRATNGAMAAVVGGCEALYIHPYDVLFKKPNDFSSRIARNIQLILKYESYLDKVGDVAKGSFYIDTLTDEIAQKSWEYFNDLEIKGGWMASVQTGYLQDTIAAQAQTAQQKVDSGTQVILGVTKYPNPAEKMKAELEGVNVYHNQLFPLRRWAEKAEQERLEKE